MSLLGWNKQWIRMCESELGCCLCGGAITCGQAYLESRDGGYAHMTCVDALERLDAAADFGCDSVDGTFIKFGPRVNTRKMIRWLRKVNAQCRLFAA